METAKQKMKQYYKDRPDAQVKDRWETNSHPLTPSPAFWPSHLHAFGAPEDHRLLSTRCLILRRFLSCCSQILYKSRPIFAHRGGMEQNACPINLQSFIAVLVQYVKCVISSLFCSLSCESSFSRCSSGVYQHRSERKKEKKHSQFVCGELLLNPEALPQVVLPEPTLSPHMLVCKLLACQCLLPLCLQLGLLLFHESQSRHLLGSCLSQLLHLRKCGLDRRFEFGSTSNILQVLEESVVMLRSVFELHLRNGLDLTLKDEETLVRKVNSASLECLDLGIGRRA